MTIAEEGATAGANAGGPGEVGARGGLLRSKLSPPRVPSRIAPRGQLLDRLRTERARRLTLVCAPAGYGKTTLLGQWREAEESRTPFAWLSADERDADQVRFWGHLIAALREIHAPAGAASAEALRRGPGALEGVVLPMLLEELEDIPQSVVVVDDWHLVRSPVCDTTMRILVEQAPPSLQVVLSSRSDPNLPIGRWRAHGELSEVRAADLKLSHVETAALLRNANLHLAPEDVERLTERTEGWAAGLSLASMLLRDEEDPHAFVVDFAGDSRHVLEYVADDVLTVVGDEMRTFLLRASVLDELSSAACDAVLETQGSAATLVEIERANLFLVPIDRHGHGYRFHRLFADVLRRELARTDPEAVPLLHMRASAWFQSHGDVESAIAHAIAARDVARASELVALNWRDVANMGRLTTLARWLEALSWPEAISDAQLALVRASLAAQAARPADEIERWLEIAAAGSHSGPLANGIASIASGVALVRSLYLTMGVLIAEAEAARAVDLEAPGSPWRRQALLALGQALYLQGRAEEAHAPLREAQRLPGQRDHVPAAAGVLAYLALAELDMGRVAAAERHVGESLALLEMHGLVESHVATNTHIAAAGAHAARADLRRAVEHLELAAGLTAPSRPTCWHAHALLRLAAARHKLGEEHAAEAALEAARTDIETLADPGMLGAMLETTTAELSAPPRREGFYGERVSEAESRVLQLLAAGRSVSEVARELCLAPTTVKTHRRTIYRKLGVTTREEAAERAAELGLMEAASPPNHPG